MKIIDRWNEFMGPKDERLTAEANRCAAVGYAILIIGSALWKVAANRPKAKKNARVK